jgi:hypothetical protein
VEFSDGSAFSGLHFDLIEISTGESRFRICDSFLENTEDRSIVRYFGHCKSVVIPSSIEVLSKFCFYTCKLLSSITFESNSHLQRIEESAFSSNGLRSIVIPSSVEVLSKFYFAGCKSLSSITFESDSHLQCIEALSFSLSGIISIVIPHSVEFIDREESISPL